MGAAQELRGTDPHAHREPAGPFSDRAEGPKQALQAVRPDVRNGNFRQAYSDEELASHLQEAKAQKRPVRVPPACKLHVHVFSGKNL